MVNPVSTIPYYSYLNKLETSNSAGTLTSGTTGTTLSTLSNNAKLTATSPDSASAVSTLLGTGGFAPSVLSLLQSDGSSSFDPIASLLNGPTSNTGAQQLDSGIYNAVAAAALQKAQVQNQNPAPATGTPQQTDNATDSPVQDLINDSIKTATAYNSTLQQNAANLVTAGKAKTDSVISLIS